MAYSRDAFIRDQQETRESQDQSETSVRLERYGDMEDGLSQSNKIAGESQRGDMKQFRQLDNRQTDKQTNGLTELFLKSLLRLKMGYNKM